MSYTSREEFVREELRSWSSHPYFIKRRAWLIGLGAFVPLIGGVALYLMFWKAGVTSLGSLIEHPMGWLSIALALLMCGFTFFMTATICLRLSTASGSAEPAVAREGKSHDVWRWILGAGAVGAIACLFAFGAHVLEGLGATFVQRIAWIGHMLGTVPLSVLLFVADLKGVAVDDWGVRDGQGGRGAAHRSSRWTSARRWFVRAFLLGGCILPLLWAEMVMQPLRAMVAKLIAFKLFPEITNNGSGIGEVPPVLEMLGVDTSSLSTAIESVVAVATLMPLVLTGITVVTALIGFKWRLAMVNEPRSPATVVGRQGFLRRPAGESRTVGDTLVPIARLRWHGVGMPDDDSPATAVTASGKKPALAGKPATGGKPPQGGKPARAATPGVAANAEAHAATAPSTDNQADPDSPTAAASGTEEGATEDKIEIPEHLQARKPQRKTSEEGECWQHKDDVLEDQGLEAALEQGHLFLLPDGKLPSKDQLTALKKFDDIHERMLSEDDVEGRGVLPATDMLISGPRGSGRSSVLLACAIHTAALRGQSALMLCRSREHASEAVRELRELLACSGLGWFLSVAELHRDEVYRWMDVTGQAEESDGQGPAHHLDPGKAIPDILVGTPEDFERFCYGCEINTAMMRRALVRLQVLLIEDVSMFHPLQQRHLPFLIDKHKLLLGAEFAPAQCVALIPNLSESAAEALGSRLFSERERTHIVHLKPLHCEPVWIKDIKAEAPEEEFLAQLQDCLQNSLTVIGLHPKWSEESWATLDAKVRATAPRATLISDLELMGQHANRLADVIVMFDARDGDDLEALLTRMRSPLTVVVRIVPKDAWAIQRHHKTVLPVFPGPHSPSLSIAHLRSVIHFLAPFTPVPRDLWAKAGLGAARAMVGIQPMEPGFEPILDYGLKLDPPEHKATGEAAARGLEWPWVALEIENAPDDRLPPAPPANAVEIFRPLERRRALRRRQTDDGILFGLRPNDTEDQSIADWVTHKGESLDRMELAYADNVLHEYGGQIFFPAAVREQERHVVVTGSHFKGQGLGENYLPVWHCRISLPNDLAVPAWPAVTDRAQLHSVEAEWIARPAAQARLQWVGDFDAIGNARSHENPVDVVYESGLCVLFLNPSLSTAQCPSAAIAGVWSTSPEFAFESVAEAQPILAMSLQRAFRIVMPTLFNYCRVVAFQGPPIERPDGKAESNAPIEPRADSVIFFIEPFATRGTAARALHMLLNDPELALRVFKDAQAALDGLIAGGPRALARLQARAGYCFGDPLRIKKKEKAAQDAAERFATATDSVARGATTASTDTFEFSLAALLPPTSANSQAAEAFKPTPTVGAVTKDPAAREAEAAKRILESVIQSLEHAMAEAAEARRYAALHPAGPSMA